VVGGWLDPLLCQNHPSKIWLSYVAFKCEVRVLTRLNAHATSQTRVQYNPDIFVTQLTNQCSLISSTIQVVIGSLMKLAGGSPSFAGELKWVHQGFQLLTATMRHSSCCGSTSHKTLSLRFSCALAHQGQAVWCFL